MELCAALALASLLGAAASVRGGQDAVALTTPHEHPSKAFTFRTPSDWIVRGYGSEGGLEARGSGSVVRFVYRPDDAGFDTLHVTCMLERLAREQDVGADVTYEYDFLSGGLGDFRFLDSAQRLHYDTPVEGQRDWRQRNLTVVGKNLSLCIIVNCPTKEWKRSKKLLDAIVASLTFQ
jgi:hypothetical protein